MAADKWSNAYLDALRQQGDPLADACVEQLRRTHTLQEASALFAKLSTIQTALSDEVPQALHDFFAATAALPPDVDLERIRRGETVFITHAFPAALVLLAKSLPSGYAAPNLAIILNLSGDLVTHPYKRLLGVLQMVVNVATCRGFTPNGVAILTAQKLRLLHAGIRHIVCTRVPEYATTYGVPVNHEDMLATIMGFSYLVIVGLRQLGCGLSVTDEEDLYYLWRIYAGLMGIQTADIPGDVADAEAFYGAYSRRHYVSAADNPNGVALARSNLQMLQEMLPPVLRWCGLKALPRIYMQELIGAEGCLQVGLRPVSGHKVLQTVLRYLPPLWLGAWGAIGSSGQRLHEVFAQLVFRDMITRAYDGEVVFAIPDSLADLHQLVITGRAAAVRTDPQ